ncbi:MAG: phage major capsid protein [Clostridium sp.]
MDLKKLLALINSKTDKKKGLVERSQLSTDIEEVRSIGTEVEDLEAEITELRSIYDALAGTTPGITDESWQQGETRAQQSGPGGGFNPIASYSNPTDLTTRSSEEDSFGSVEYRNAFKDYIVKGTPIPDKFNVTEERADALSTVGDIGAVIPTTIMNKVIEDITVEGKILNRITQTSYQGGISIPISEVNPEATWLSDEETVSDEQKAKMEAKLTFGYHVLEAKIAIGLLSATVSLSIFETTVVKQLKKAMIRAIETAIVKGSGSGQPLGFTKVELPNEKVISMNATNIGTVSKWAEVEGAIPEAVEDSVIYIMAKPTWEKYLNGMVDTLGQRIGLGKINERGQKILNGREVLTLDKLPSLDSASEGDIFGAVIDLSQYLLNSNLAMYYKKYYNEDKNKWIHKALMIADGKMAMGKDSTNKLVGADGLLFLKKGTALSRTQLKALDKARMEAEQLAKEEAENNK